MTVHTDCDKGGGWECGLQNGWFAYERRVSFVLSRSLLTWEGQSHQGQQGFWCQSIRITENKKAQLIQSGVKGIYEILIHMVFGELNFKVLFLFNAKVSLNF